MALREKSIIAATTLKRVAGRFLIMRKRIPHPVSFVEFLCGPLRPSAFSALKMLLAQSRRGPQRSPSGIIRAVKRAFAIAILILVSSARSGAEQLPIRTYTTADGLARDRIYKIVSDPSGFLWFCTYDGLSRFDGYEFVNYSVED